MKKSFHLIFVFILLQFSTLNASIFDIFGMGNSGLNYGVSSQSRGYTSVAVSDSFSVNLQNPAMNAFYKTTGFAMGARSVSYSLKDVGIISNQSGFEYGLLRFPVTKKGGALLGFYPLYAADGEFTTHYAGSGYSEQISSEGSIYAGTIGFGYRILPNLAAGVNFEILTGGIDFKDYITFVDESYTPAQLYRTSGIDGRQAAFGILWQPINKLSIGFSFKKNIWLDSQSIVSYNSTNSSSYYLFSGSDTTLTSSYTLPSQLNIGFSYKLSESFELSADFLTIPQSEDIQNFGLTVIDPQNYSHIGLGFEKRGNQSEFSQYFSRISYRMGLFYNKNSVDISSGADFISSGLTLGLGLPFNKLSSRFDFAFIVGTNKGNIYQRSGLTVNEAMSSEIDELFFEFKIGFISTEKWFNTKGKYR